MMRSLYSGVSGLRTHQTKMDVIGNNIANVNTVAFKSSAVTFSDIMYQTTSGASGATETTGGVNAKQIGLGVSTAATKVTITSAGASESTGNAFDIKLTDSNSTNFFIVSNGTENVFTRAGSFYIDGNGNLAMSSTGYLVQGWQVDESTGSIKKDTVSALRIMSALNQTSSPEATKNAYVSGVVDKNDVQVTSDSGYYMSLSFYDNLGYSYTAKFAIRGTDESGNNGIYTVELVNILDDDNNDILAQYVAAGGALSDIFGVDTASTATIDLDSSVTFSGGLITIGGTQYTPSQLDVASDGNVYLTGSSTVLTTTAALYNMSESALTTKYGANATYSINDTTGALEVAYTATVYGLNYSTSDGTFKNVGGNGNSVTMNLTAFQTITDANGDRLFPYSDAFSDISVDFSGTKNFDNGGTSTAGIEKGDSSGTQGVGKALGTMTGVTVSNNGEIYGSYSNGNTVLLGQIAVAQFSNASGLESIGNNCYAETLNSGEFDGIGVDVTADGGSMSTGQLEMSNVDLSQEFTSMITTQRGFQANSRIITVSDSMLEELTNLKRS